MITVSDQLGRYIHLRAYPQRIISLVPSQTELLFDLGLDKEVIGITKFCVHPPNWFQTKTRVGGTKNLRMSTIHSLQPDLIIANREENTKEQIEELAAQYPVWISDVNDLGSALHMIASIGELTNMTANAKTIGDQIEQGFRSLSDQVAHQEHIRSAAYLIWKDPYMTAGRNTFINALLKACGLKNIFEHLSRYPEIEVRHLQTPGNPAMPACELLLLSSEPYPFTQKHILELQVQLPGTKIILVDGEMFSWYGSRLLKAPEYFKKLLAAIHSS